MTALFLLFAGFIILAVLASRFNIAGFKGKLGEWTVDKLLRSQLSTDIYTVLNDVTLASRDGTTQIDHLVVSPFGVFVIETKNMTGWIFGSEGDAMWTQSFRRSRNRFQNPLRQNYAHTKALEVVLGLSESQIHSVIVFVGEAQFKTRMPDNVLKANSLAAYISSKQDRVIPSSDLSVLIAKIEAKRFAQGATTNEAHIASLKSKHGEVSGLLTDSRKLVKQVSVTLVAIKTFIGAFGIALALWGLSLLVDSLGQAYKTVITPTSKAVVKPAAPASASIPGQTPAQKTTGPITFTNTALERAQANAEAQKLKIATEKQQKWEASLFCAHSEDTGRCACYEPKGPKADVTFEQCMTLAQKSVN